MKKLFLIPLTCFLLACETTYYSAMEQVGVHKRDILVDRVQEGRESQLDAQKQFRSALEQFKSVVDFDGGNLEKRYNKLNKEFEASEDSAEEIHERVDGIESVAKALFKEWKSELAEYSSASLRRQSQEQLNATQRQYDQLISAMRSAEAKLDPVLDAMRDQVLFLKHNLNASAIKSLKGEVVTINRDVDRLLAAMEEAISEADKFISQMKS
ncbi:DUF2959 domain-containing protein [Aurantivibrio infirmus]